MQAAAHAAHYTQTDETGLTYWSAQNGLQTATCEMELSHPEEAKGKTSQHLPAAPTADSGAWNLKWTDGDFA